MKASTERGKRRKTPATTACPEEVAEGKIFFFELSWRVKKVKMKEKHIPGYMYVAQFLNKHPAVGYAYVFRGASH